MAQIAEGMARIEAVAKCFTSNYSQGIAPGVVADVPEDEAAILIERGDALKAGNKSLGAPAEADADPDNAAVEGADAE